MSDTPALRARLAEIRAHAAYRKDYSESARMTLEVLDTLEALLTEREIDKQTLAIQREEAVEARRVIFDRDIEIAQFKAEREQRRARVEALRKPDVFEPSDIAVQHKRGWNLAIDAVLALDPKEPAGG